MSKPHKVNFSDSEVKVLLDCVARYKEVLLSADMMLFVYNDELAHYMVTIVTMAHYACWQGGLGLGRA